MTTQDDLNGYITASREVGMSDEQISQTLITHGWAEEIVRSALQPALNPVNDESQEGFEPVVEVPIQNGETLIKLNNLPGWLRLAIEPFVRKERRTYLLVIIGVLLSVLPFILAASILLDITFYRQSTSDLVGALAILVGLIVVVWIPLWSGVMQKTIRQLPFVIVPVAAASALFLSGYYGATCTGKMCEFAAIIFAIGTVFAFLLALFLRALATLPMWVVYGATALAVVSFGSYVSAITLS